MALVAARGAAVATAPCNRHGVQQTSRHRSQLQANWSGSATLQVGFCVASATLLGRSRHPGRRGSRSYIAEVAATRRQATSKTIEVAAEESIANLLQQYLQQHGPANGLACALVLVPRKRAAEMRSLVDQVSASLGAGATVVGLLTGGQRLALTCIDGLQAPAQVSSVLDSVSVANFDAQLSAAQATRTLLIFADPTKASPYLQQQAFEASARALPGATKVGIVAAPAPEATSPSVVVAGVPDGAITAVSLPLAALVGLSLAGCTSLGEPLEVFEADVKRGAPSTVLQIGTDEEGDAVLDTAETEKGTAGIVRRKGIAPAKALQDVMKANGVGSPKEMLLGVPRRRGETPALVNTGLVPSASDWSIFYWAGITPQGGVTVGGGDLVAEDLCPVGQSLEWLQPLRAGQATGPQAWGQAVQECASQASGKALVATFALAGGRGLAPQEGQVAAAALTPTVGVTGALGMAILLGLPNAGLAVHRQAVAVLVLHE